MLNLSSAWLNDSSVFSLTFLQYETPLLTEKEKPSGAALSILMDMIPPEPSASYMAEGLNITSTEDTEEAGMDFISETSSSFCI